MDERPPLDEIFKKCQTDKGSDCFTGGHNYTPCYEKYFQSVRDKPLKFLEIGINDARFRGASMRAWYEYLPNASLIGIDIEDTKWQENDRLKTFKGHQGIRGCLKNFTNEFGKDFDFIIDDGSHIDKDFLISLGYFYPHLKPGGVYFIEDLQFSEAQKGVEIFKRFMATGRFDIHPHYEYTTVMLEEAQTYIEENTKQCNFFCDDKLFVLERKEELGI